ncbi:hypothetical protein MCOR07_008683 [Pyricularia oryzae]|nr:hypothetical protein MCOR30_010781 [Pyricularia oryzae]KAI6351480.1 hypothetical protein MCOR32_011639 [Pyricularia oryzae]KAI6390850.1 hypothetical protein MCOR20_011494 [Pyricularia oryzae]KAI6414204.1 hypothetical protein MCOR21_011625 [Pyricularia oryzae]KAI6452582.1 hypothetical protein MCOR22_000769 [Pyricularia oryzae]
MLSRLTPPFQILVGSCVRTNHVIPRTLSRLSLFAGCAKVQLSLSSQRKPPSPQEASQTVVALPKPRKAKFTVLKSLPPVKQRAEVHSKPVTLSS